MAGRTIRYPGMSRLVGAARFRAADVLTGIGGIQRPCTVGMGLFAGIASASGIGLRPALGGVVQAGIAASRGGADAIFVRPIVVGSGRDGIAAAILAGEAAIAGGIFGDGVRAGGIASIAGVVNCIPIIEDTTLVLALSEAGRALAVFLVKIQSHRAEVSVDALRIARETLTLDPRMGAGLAAGIADAGGGVPAMGTSIAAAGYCADAIIIRPIVGCRGGAGTILRAAPMPGRTIRHPGMSRLVGAARFRAADMLAGIGGIRRPCTVDMGLVAGIASAGEIGLRPALGGVVRAFSAAGIAGAGGSVPSGDCAAGLMDALCATVAGAGGGIPGAICAGAGVVAGGVAGIAGMGGGVPIIEGAAPVFAVGIAGLAEADPTIVPAIAALMDALLAAGADAA